MLDAKNNEINQLGKSMRQICYASTSTSDHVQLLQDVRDILSEARDFNALHNIPGVLYYADQHYFQCLEGDEAVLQLLMSKLLKDPRHKEIKVFEAKTIQGAHFKAWGMKYVQRMSSVHTKMREMGFATFEPQSMSQQQIDQLLQDLYDA